MKALFLVNPDGGGGRILKNVDKIVNQLKAKFDQVDYFICETKSELKEHCDQACGVYDALIFAGGDGTFHQIVNNFACKDNAPILGVIPSGTLCDAAKNFGASKNYKKAIDIILKGDVIEFDIGKINDKYFVFETSIGAYSDIPYIVSQKSKKRFGHFVYYFKAVPQMFKMKKVPMTLKLEDGVTLDIETPFLLIMNSSYMGGFKINKESSITDGYLDVFYSKCEPFNGLFSYFFFKKRVKHLRVKSMNVLINDHEYWDVDGEKGPLKNAAIQAVPKKLKMFFKNKNN